MSNDTKPVIDCDVHPMTRDGWRDLKRHVASAMRGRVEAAFEGFYPSGGLINDSQGGANFADDAWMPDGGRPGSDPYFTRDQLLEGHGVDCAVLVPLEQVYVSNLTDIDVGVEMARAFNDYFVEQWLPADSRYQLMIGVTPHDPAAAAREIRRLANVPGVVAVLFGLPNILMGHRHYWPIYEAAEEARLPVVTHVGGGGAKHAGGILTSYTQDHVTRCQVAMSNTVNLVFEGTFQRFPSLTVVFAEWSFSWLVYLLWGMDREWTSLRAETPWLQDRPSLYVRRHIRYTTQPIDEPEKQSDLGKVVEMVHGDELLLFSSDYPHWDNEFPARALRGIPSEVQRRIFHQNALESFPRLKLASTVGV